MKAGGHSWQSVEEDNISCRSSVNKKYAHVRYHMWHIYATCIRYGTWQGSFEMTADQNLPKSDLEDFVLFSPIEQFWNVSLIVRIISRMSDSKFDKHALWMQKVQQVHLIALQSRLSNSLGNCLCVYAH